jgi:hypothetical protein
MYLSPQRNEATPTLTQLCAHNVRGPTPPLPHTHTPHLALLLALKLVLAAPLEALLLQRKLLVLVAVRDASVLRATAAV